MPAAPAPPIEGHLLTLQGWRRDLPATGAWADLVALDPATLQLRQAWAEGEAL